MRSKYVLIIIFSYIFVWITGIAIGISSVVPVYAIKGWETWETDSEVGLEVYTDYGDFRISKEPYTTDNVKVEKIKY